MTPDTGAAPRLPSTYLFVPGNRPELAWARRVSAAMASGAGAVQVDGKMVDRPVIARAMRILARA